MVTRSCRGQCCRRMKSGFSFQQNGSLGGFDTRITFLPSCFLSNSNSPFDETIHNLSSSSLSLKLKRCWKRKRLRRFSDVLYFRPSEGPSSALKKMSLFSQRWVFTLIECLGGSHTLIWNEEKRQFLFSTFSAFKFESCPFSSYNYLGHYLGNTGIFQGGD